CAELRPASVEALPVFRGMLDGHQNRAAPLAAKPEALDQPTRYEQHRRPYAERFVGRQNADYRRRHAHNEQGEIEHRLAADRVAKMAKNETAKRARHEAEGVGRKRQQRTDHRIEGWKE